MNFTRKDIGYTICSRLEEALRLWIRDRLLKTYGGDWLSQIPKGVLEKALEKEALTAPEGVSEPLDLLEEVDLPDLSGIVGYRKGFARFVPGEEITQEDFLSLAQGLYPLRNKIAHVKQTFTAFDLAQLISIARALLPILRGFSDTLETTLNSWEQSPSKVLVHVPSNFLAAEEPVEYCTITNLPPSDYDPDGGFIGRKDDIAKLEKLLLGELHRVITITGAGGVGKSALAHHVCQRILTSECPFSAVVWVSAKEEILTLSGIEAIEPSVRGYEDLIDAVLTTFGWADELTKSIIEKEHSFEVILKANDKGLLLVVDNLETLADDRVKEFIKDFPPPNKVLITSRLGLGEVERRYPLREMSNRDAIQLVRTIALEKGLRELASIPNDTLTAYVDRMARYPLAIKWVLGQVALGKDMEAATTELVSPTGDVARFCFERIFTSALSEGSKLILCALASLDRAPTRGILAHLTNLPPDDLDSAIQQLTVASLTIPFQEKVSETRVETRYDLLPLTREFIRGRLQDNPEMRGILKGRIEAVQTLREEAERADRQLRASFAGMGAQTDEERIAATLVNTATRRHRAGDYARAVSLFEQASRAAQGFHPIYLEWANVEAAEGYYDKAQELLGRVKALAPNDPDLWISWGSLEKRRTRYEEASQHLRKAMTLDPGNIYATSELAEVEKRRGNFEVSIALLKGVLGREKATRGHRTSLITLTQLADTGKRWAESLSQRDQFGEALSRLNEALEYARMACDLTTEPEEIALATFREVSTERGMLLERVKSLGEGRQDLYNAIVRNPKNHRERRTTSRACLALAQSLMLSSKVDEARKHYELGLSLLQPDSPLATRYEQLRRDIEGGRRHGKLADVIQGKGYGFIRPTDNPTSTVFVHMNEFFPVISLMQFEALEGVDVSYALDTSGPKGPRAKRVTIDR